MFVSDLHRDDHAFCVTRETSYEGPVHATGRLRAGWLVREISESFSGLVLKTCWPVNTTRGPETQTLV